MANLPSIDTTVAHSARVWNYWLGGKDHYPVDREMGDYVLQAYPEMVAAARADREFLIRAVTFLAQQGIRQFLDVGTGLPTHNNTHEVAQALDPRARVVYTDNDPLVLAHARALLVGTEEGRTDYVDADLTDPGAILEAAARTLDLDRPVALMLLGVLNFVGDDTVVRDVLDQLLDALAPGSFLVIAHPTDEVDHERAHEVAEAWNERGTPLLTMRSADRVRSFFGELELLEPGLVSCPLWRPEATEVGTVRPVAEYGGVARKS